MSRNELIAKIETLQTLEALIEETKAEAETVRNSIKAEMEAADTEELSAGGYIVRWTSVLTTRFDTKSFKEKFGEEIYIRKAPCLTAYQATDKEPSNHTTRAGTV